MYLAVSTVVFVVVLCCVVCVLCFFFQAEDGIRDLVRSRGLGDVYKRQSLTGSRTASFSGPTCPTPPCAWTARTTKRPADCGERGEQGALTRVRCTAYGRGDLSTTRPGSLGCRSCLLYTSDAADERSSVDLGGRRLIKKKKKEAALQHERNSEWKSTTIKGLR